MKTTITCTAVALLMTTASLAQDFPAPTGYASHTTMSEVESLRAEFEAREGAWEQRFAELERELAAAAGSDCCCDPCCRGWGWLGSAQAVWLKPFQGGGTGIITGTGGAPLGTDYEVSPRLELGYSRCDGLGLRVRYWEYDQAVAGEFMTAAPFTLSQSWDTWVGDIEITDSTKLGCRWDATFAVGFRHVEYDEVFGITQLNSSQTFGRSFVGDGLTAAAELRRPLSCNWGLFANARGSALYGNDHLVAIVDLVDFQNPPIDVPIPNTVKVIVEAQAGVEWTRHLACGGYLYARGFAEVQYWDSISPGPPIQNELLLDLPFGLAGFGASLGVVR